MDDLATRLGNEWENLGRRLNVSRQILGGLSGYDQTYKAREMLKIWQRDKGDSATYHVLNKELRHEFVARQDLAQKICCLSLN